VHVSVKTKSGAQEAFKEASLKKALHSPLKPGVVCFDVLQDQQDDTTFVLVEFDCVYGARGNRAIERSILGS
jgi:quinol monooxygenase YgiN